MFYISALLAALINGEFVFRLVKFGFRTSVAIRVFLASFAAIGTSFAFFEFSGRDPWPDSLFVGMAALAIKFLFFPGSKPAS